jgi:hypothetical protein
MTTKRFYALAAVHTPGNSLPQKILLALLILALMFAALPAASVLAAPASGKDTTEFGDLEQEWGDKLRTLRVQGLFYDRVLLPPADFDSQADLARAHDLLDKYGFALRQANTVVFNHAGFDIKGRVTNENHAYESVHNLAMYLQMMRGFREKMDEVTP